MKNYPSTLAMKAAVELEIYNAIGRVQTVGIGDLIQKVIDATIEECAAEIERLNWPCVGDARRIASSIRALSLSRPHRGGIE
jgi:hypothetical protein